MRELRADKLAKLNTFPLVFDEADSSLVAGVFDPFADAFGESSGLWKRFAGRMACTTVSMFFEAVIDLRHEQIDLLIVQFAFGDIRENGGELAGRGPVGEDLIPALQGGCMAFEMGWLAGQGHTPYLSIQWASVPAAPR